MATFSGLVQAMESAIVMVMGGRVQRATHALLSEYTVGPLVRAWGSVLIETCGQDAGSGPTYHKELEPEDRELLSALCNEVAAIDEIRNDLAHGAWFVGWGNEQTIDWSEAGFMRVKNTKTGADFAAGRLAPMLKGKPTAVVLDELADRADVVAMAVRAFSGVLQMKPEIPAERARKLVKVGKKGRSRVVYYSPDGGVTWRGSDGSIDPAST